jgi:hypothetical protein
MDHLNIPLNEQKTVLPSTTVLVHGIEVDSINMVARLPTEKLETARNQLITLCHKKKATLKEIQSILGLLNFTCKVIKPGRAFLHRLIDLTIGITKPYHFIKITKEVQSDIRTWLSFLENFNGTTILTKQLWQNSQQLSLFTDASSLHGFGIVNGKKWAFGIWDQLEKYHINILELYPIVLSVLLWPSELSNKCILFFSDNEAVVQILNSQTCKCHIMMKLVRLFVLQCLSYNILFRLKHIKGKFNTTADLLSRLQVMEARRISPHLNHEPVLIPHHYKLSQLLSESTSSCHFLKQQNNST